ncbi:MAG: methylated-DNA--[protein]-cysteine S-methyltransferase [Alphaproteobacteria bacterium]|nr:methylated-DNA--[protein]-cysteine S-methyltransferase [Alphaproteobacteria bacterium]|tara:strand:+ start:327 stop:800 length:474 start_codon:yes stop_codon:yes gene_type:complete
MKISSTIIETNLGKIYIETINKSVVKLEWTNIKKIPKIETANTLLKNVKKQIIRYFNGEKIKFNIPVNPKGTKFQKKVWKYIQKINWGKKKSYNDISEKIFNKKKSLGARAIGSACSNNPILIIIPCHRIICSNGDLGGYRKGQTKKKELLKIEKSI